MTDGSNNPREKIRPGRFTLVFEDVFEEDDEPYPLEITFNWDGERAASFVYDSWQNPSDPTFVAEINSDPVYGWASWLNEEDVSIAFLHPMAETEGWARVDGGAPGAGLDDPEDALTTPEVWTNLAKLINEVVADRAVRGMTRQTF